MFKLLLKLIFQRAKVSRWQMEIGAHLLKKGCGYQVGQVLKSKKIQSTSKKSRVTYISGLTFDFETNKIFHRTGKTIAKI